MEELRNNETSEKKERIEPLEVITLEGDAIPAEGEATDSPCVRRGNLYKKDGLQWRTFHVNADETLLISMTTNDIVRIKTDSLINDIENGTVSACDVEPNPSFSLTEEEINVITERARVFENIIEKEMPEIENLFSVKKAKRNNDAEAILLGVSRRWLRKMLKAYLRSGRNKFSLIDHRKGNYRKKVPHSKDYENPKNDVDEILKYGLKMFVKYGKPGMAYDAVLRRYFREPVEAPDGSSVKMVTLPEEERSVSYKMLYNYIRKHTEDYSCKGKDERDKQNNNRQLVGNSRTGVYELGQIVEADEMELGCYVVDQNDGETVLGKAVVYCMVEVLSGICIGAYVSLENNSMRGFQQVFLSLLEPHKNQTKGYNIDYDEEDWPSMIVPNEIRCDRGSEYMSKAYSKAMGELGIRNTPVPPGCGSLKGVVESFNGLVQTYLKAQLKNNGYIEDKYRGGDLAKGAACLTLEEIRGLVYQSVILYNRRVFEGLIDKKYLDNNVSPTPKGIFAYEKAHGRAGDPTNVNDATRPAYLFAMLAKEEEKRKFTWNRRKGIVYTFYKTELRFYSQEPWFLDILKDEPHPEDIEVRYNVDDIRNVYIRYKKEIHRVPLAEKIEQQYTYADLTWDEYDECIRKKRDSKVMKEAKQVYLDTKLNLQDTVEKQAEMAKALNPKKKKYGKAHPEDKTAKKQEMRKDPDEITKRSYNSIDPEPEKETLTKQQEELAAIEHLRIPDEMRRTMGDRKLSREEEINRILALIEDEV
ncbi:transposase [Holdemanella biformis]|uniref:transposase n=1 Tax=Holdemanella biformis TaxID=1735 RepID=UPI002673A4E8|nr:transposase [Holdemanella biformis]